jgi:hypothetical protein
VADPTFGELARKDPRNFWPDVAVNFTSWLASEETLPLIGRVLGMELQFVDRPVGPYRADIVYRSLGDERSVVIENHLRKLITTASGSS